MARVFRLFYFLLVVHEMPKQITWRGQSCTGTVWATSSSLPVPGQAEELAQTDQVQAISRAPGRMGTLHGGHTSHDTNPGVQGLGALPAALVPRVTWHSLGKWTAERGHKDVTQSCCCNAGCPNWFRRMFWRLTGLWAVIIQHLKTNRFSCPTYPLDDGVDPKCSQCQRPIQSDGGFESCL